MQQVVWITGASKGIGKALALKYATEGWKVIATARNAADLADVKQEATSKKLPGTIHPYPGDVTHEDAMARIIALVQKDIGHIDHVILNAGSHIPVELPTIDLKTFRTLIDINIMGVLHCLVPLIRSHQASDPMITIGVVSSIAGVNGLPSAAAYGLTKAGLINMCEALKFDGDAAGIDIRVIEPGFVRTPLTDQNDFDMPFMISSETAAQRIYKGLSGKQFCVHFPYRLTLSLKFMRILPYPAYFWLMRRMTGWKK